MNTKIFTKCLERLSISIFSLFLGVLSFAQDSGNSADTRVKVTTTGTTTTTTEEWYSNPIYWVVGAILFIILIAIIVRGNSNKN
ncbi:hypothetical protein [Chryseobacterium sp.]|uniref:hypothetical protein n=1 Tax=Chryseobacterium sp. TaxID=1871047 RepID=UPI00388EADFE